MQSLHSSLYLDLVNREREEIVARSQENRAIALNRGPSKRVDRFRHVFSQSLIAFGERVRPEDRDNAPVPFDESAWVKLAR